MLWPQTLQTDLTPALASVWLVHGLYNKLLGGSPRHLAIVQSVPGLARRAGERVLIAVGLFEVAIALWILSGARRGCAPRRRPSRCSSMNVLELTFARPLLLWPAGLLPLNLVFLARSAWIAAGSRGPRAPASLATACAAIRSRSRRTCATASR